VTIASSLGTPDRQVFMAAGETPGPSGTRPDRYFEDISADELSANAPSDETNDNKNARRECNRKRNERRRRLCETLHIRNLIEALDQVERRMHTTFEQCHVYHHNSTLGSGGCVWQPTHENTVLSPKSNPLWSLSYSKVSSGR
jgi:hypothetical protein